MRQNNPRRLEIRDRGSKLTGSRIENRTAVLLTVTVAVGAGGMLGQLLIMRELLVSFCGNELTLGVVLANWLLMEAAGALAAGRKVDSLRRALYLYILFLVLYALLLPASLFFSPGAQYLFFSPLPGETVGIVPLFLTSLLLMAPPAFVHGALFPLGCRLLSDSAGEKGAIGRIYLYEIIGTLSGGVIFTFLLAERYHSLELSLGIGILHLLGGAGLLGLFSRSVGSGVKLVAPRVALLGTALLLLVSFPSISGFLHERSLERMWRGQEVVHYENSPYGNIVIVHSKGEYTFFYDGRPVITSPAPDTALIADFVHLAAAAHPDPQRSLLLAGGPGGFLDELLKHPLEEVVYVELDPRLPKVVAEFSTPMTERELGDPRVEVQYLDGRLFLARTERKFDLVLLGFITPETLQTNRLFTTEFFSLIRQRLNEGGIIAFTAPGSSVYMGPEMIVLNASLYSSLQETFEHVQVIAGDLNIFLASTEPLKLVPAILEERLAERGVAVGFISRSYLEYRLDPGRESWLTASLEGSEARLNHDLNPAAFFYALTYWGGAFSPEVLKYMALLERLGVWHYIFTVFAVTVTLLAVLAKSRRRRTAALVWAVFTSGWAGMSFDLLVLFAFQCLYGFVYQMAGLLVASFMAGTFCGGLWGMRRPVEQKRKTFLCLEAAVAALLFLFYPVVLCLQLLAGHAPGELVLAILAAFSLLSGFAVGAQFPLAAALFSRKEEQAEKVGGIFYGADLLGGWGAGLVVSVALFPLLGLWQTLLVLGLVKTGSLVLFSIYGADAEETEEL